MNLESQPGDKLVVVQTVSAPETLFLFKGLKYVVSTVNCTQYMKRY
jgi:hypothetical protein